MTEREQAAPSETVSPDGFDGLSGNDEQDVVVLRMDASKNSPNRSNSVFFASTGTVESFGDDLEAISQSPGDLTHVRMLTGGREGELFAVIETPDDAVNALSGVAIYSGTAVLRVVDVPSETVFDDPAATANVTVNFSQNSTEATIKMVDGTSTNSLGISSRFSDGEIDVLIAPSGTATMQLTGFNGATLVNPTVTARQVFAGPDADEIAGIAVGRTDDTEATVIYAGARQ